MTAKEDIYTRVTNKIIADLEKGTLTWMQPWNAAHAAGPVSRPLRSTGQPYQGINVLILWAAAMEQHYSAPIWMTYKQAEALGGQVRKGEKGTQVVYADAFTKTETDDATGEEKEKRIPFLKTYTVFNVEQIDGLPGHYTAPAQVNPHEHDRNVTAEAFFRHTGATIQHGGNSAFYSPATDHVQMPPITAFPEAERYYATLAHEITHWTKHPQRLNRDFGRKRFGDAGYAMEELVAELGAAFLGADLGIRPEPREETAAYIQSWLKVLKNDKQAIFTAASHAQRAADFLHRTVEQAEARISDRYEHATEQEQMRAEALYQRGEDGYPIGADAQLRAAYGPIPEAVEFHHDNGGSGVPKMIHGWQWSGTFGRWTALVTFANGWRGFTTPLPVPSQDRAIRESADIRPEEYEQQQLF